ncbi:hypothetical protein EV586_103375 [Tumebacillus sp. BK434]|nr:hypothetical protein EV586_103375 [Tumebacillus sp. BK434]
MALLGFAAGAFVFVALICGMFYYTASFTQKK